MNSRGLEKALGDLGRVGTLVKDRGYRQVWRFELDGEGYYLKFYPRRPWWKRMVRGNPALREFFRLQLLQKAAVAAPRPVAVLNGFRLEGRRGDAVVLEAIEPAAPLDEYLQQFQLHGERAPDHHSLARQIIQIVYELGAAQLGHDDLHLGNFLLKEGKLYLLDAYAVHRGGMRMRDVLQLAHAVRGWATRTDLLRAWKALKFESRLPRRNPVSRRWWAKAARRVMRENRYFGKWTLRPGAGGKSFGLSRWKAHYFKQFKYPRRWSEASRLRPSAEDWRGAWEKLWEEIRGDRLEVLKRTRSGDVLGGKVALGGTEIPVIIKRPRRKRWYRYFNEIGRGGRARRAWRKSWWLIERGLPTAWPLLLMERRVLGYVTDQVIVFERLAGPTLDQCNLDALASKSRQDLFRRAGALLRRMEEDDLYHYDAKPSNWIVRDDPVLGPFPILIDVDGIRRIRWIALGIRRLLRGMRHHPQYTPEDSLELCLGYAPFAPIGREPPVEDEDGDDGEDEPDEAPAE